MVQSTPTLQGHLEMNPIVEAFMRGIAEKSSSLTPGNGEGVGMFVTPFFFPSVGTTFARISYTCDSRREGESYFVKSFDPEFYHPLKDGKSKAWRRVPTKLAPAELEHVYLDAFKSQGCAVPASFVIGNYMIVMEDCGVVSLEEKLRRNGNETLEQTAERQETVFASLAQEQAKFSVAGKKLQIPADAYDRIKIYSDLQGTFAGLFDYWRPAPQEEERKRFLEATKILWDFSYGIKPERIILGDSSTFHVLFSPNGLPRWIDIEKIREGHPTADFAGHYLSPESVLSFNAIERLLRLVTSKEVEIETDGQRRAIEDDAWKEYLRAFYVDGITECFRRETKIRQLETYFPDKHAAFVERHSGFRNAFDRYRERIGAVSQKMRENGLYTDKEKTRLDDATQAIINLTQEQAA